MVDEVLWLVIDIVIVLKVTLNYQPTTFKIWETPNASRQTRIVIFMSLVKLLGLILD